jgi:hypothetical protein
VEGPVEYASGEPPENETVGVEAEVRFGATYGVIENWYPVNASIVSD